ncbi:MAG: hypothetical protein K8J08_15290 [Thermoanaerobaculia bacterium]|nr:hypothetical protein [Thermoanaerobaculia bacterium]
MSRTSVLAIGVALVLSAASILALPVPSADTPVESLMLELRQTSPASAATAIRTLVGSAKIEIVGEHSLKIRDSTQNLSIAEDVIGMLEQPRTDADRPIFRSVPSDDTVIVAVSTDGLSPGDLMKALREETRSRKVVVDSATSTLMIRDSQKGVDAALEILEELKSLARK